MELRATSLIPSRNVEALFPFEKHHHSSCVEAYMPPRPPKPDDERSRQGAMGGPGGFERISGFGQLPRKGVHYPLSGGGQAPDASEGGTLLQIGCLGGFFRSLLQIGVLRLGCNPSSRIASRALERRDPTLQKGGSGRGAETRKCL